ncbi:MAG: hypothetical protein KGJ87_02960 [Planctomycetota bacterium]|nr:hypothetical protein [Planctomycetota bacterium]MDE1890796.1 hypothetical protein [Planctomycetota bacterium]MDE2216112.1 hypothetical protein [Planctomycetota bacterium]
MIEDHGLKENEIQYTVATGYGRRMVSSNEVVTEITANATAAKWLMHNKVNVRTLINIGGQDRKVIALDSKGIMLDFAMMTNALPEEDDSWRSCAAFLRRNWTNYVTIRESKRYTAYK